MSCILGRIFPVNSLVLNISGYTLFDKKTKTRLNSGSTQTAVPVKPVWPNVFGDAYSEVGPFQSLIVGLSQPSPLLFESYCFEVNSSMVSGL